MGEDVNQREALRQRLSQLLSTHHEHLSPSSWQAERGTVVIEQGATADTVLLVQSGELGVETIDEHGTATLVATVRSGELLGEMGLFGDCRHSARVTVTSANASLLQLGSDALLQAVMFDAELALELLALNTRRCQQGNHHLSLILEALRALQNGREDSLTTCCTALSTGPANLQEAAQLLQDLFRRIQRHTAEVSTTSISPSP